MTYVHPNLSEHYGSAFDLGDLTHRLNDATDHLELAAALYDLGVQDRHVQALIESIP